MRGRGMGAGVGGQRGEGIPGEEKGDKSRKRREGGGEEGAKFLLFICFVLLLFCFLFFLHGSEIFFFVEFEGVVICEQGEKVGRTFLNF